MGNFRDSKDLHQLDIRKITHILSICDDARKTFKVIIYAGHNNNIVIIDNGLFIWKLHCLGTRARSQTGEKLRYVPYFDQDPIIVVSG